LVPQYDRPLAESGDAPGCSINQHPRNETVESKKRGDDETEEWPRQIGKWI
jgi:hypothetical protein